MSPDLDTLLRRFHAGDRLALSRLLSLVARGEQGARILAAVEAKPSRVVAVTGSAGVGKSTLIGKLIGHLRQNNLTVAVLACDPQSPLSGGALLGDRFRMAGDPDDGVFIRSLAALSGHGAVADHLPAMTHLLSAFGFDVVLVETVGAGQGDTAVAELADVVVLLLQPETGDDLQWEKAGVLEVADVIAVQKADLPRADAVAAQVLAAVELSGDRAVPVLLVSAKTGQGVAELWQAVAAAAPREHGHQDRLEELLQQAQRSLVERFHAVRAGDRAQLDHVLSRWEREEISGEEAGGLLLKLLAQQ